MARHCQWLPLVLLLLAASGCMWRANLWNSSAPLPECPYSSPTVAPVEAARPLIQSRHVAGAVTLAFSPSGRYLASASLDGIKIWDVSQRTLVQDIRAERFVGARRMFWGASERELGFLDMTGHWKWVDVSTPEGSSTLQSLPPPQQMFSDVVSREAGPIAWAGATWMGSPLVFVYDSSRSLRQLSFPAEMNRLPRDLEMAPDASTLAATVEDSDLVALWEPADLSREPLLLPTGQSIKQLLLLPGRRVLVLGGDHMLRLFEATSDGRVRSLSLPGALNEEHATDSPSNSASSMAVSKDGSILALIARGDVSFWELSTGRHLWTWLSPLSLRLPWEPVDANTSSLDGTPVATSFDGAWGVTFSPDGKQVVISMSSGRLNLVSLERRRTLAGLGSTVRRPRDVNPRYSPQLARYLHRHTINEDPEFLTCHRGLLDRRPPTRWNRGMKGQEVKGTAEGSD